MSVRGAMGGSALGVGANACADVRLRSFSVCEEICASGIGPPKMGALLFVSIRTDDRGRGKVWFPAVGSVQGSIVFMRSLCGSKHAKRFGPQT